MSAMFSNGLVGVSIQTALVSPGMMAAASLPGVELLRGRAESLPQADASSDFVSMGYALRHIADVSAAFAEFFRVLRPGGRLLVLEITKPSGRVGTLVLKTYMRSVVPTIARAVTRRPDTARLWRYYWDTIEACIPPDAVLAALRQAGFEQARRHVELGIFSEYTAVKPAAPEPLPGSDLPRQAVTAAPA